MATVSTDSILLASIATRFLPSILVTAKEIVDKIKQAKLNTRHCETLIERIQTVISYLQNSKLLKQILSNNSPLKQTVSRFSEFLKQCYTFVSYYVDRSRIRKFISSNSYNKKFNFFNNELHKYYSELTLGISIENSNQNQYLHERLTQIIEQYNIIINQVQTLSAIQ